MTPADAQAIALQRDLESIVCSPAGLGLTTATPLQRAICRIACGRPLEELAEHPDVIEAVGDPGLLWHAAPRELLLLFPSRTGKSTIVSGMALRAVQTVDVSGVGELEDPPRYSIISIEKDKARAIWTVLSNALRGPYAHLATRDPSDSAMIARVRHPSGGRELEIAVSAGKAGGGAVLSRWCVGLALDEATRMHGDERQVNVDDTRAAALDRLLPGAQICQLGSKWATEGPTYELSKANGGRPNRRANIVVLGWAGGEGHKLNPRYYTPQLYSELKDGDAAAQAAYRVARNRYQSPPQKVFDLEYLQRLSRPAPSCDCDRQQREGFPSIRDGKRVAACPHGDSPPHPRQHYLAVIDPATRGNAWALVLLTIREICDTGELPGGDGRAPRCKVGPKGPSHRPGSCATGEESALAGEGHKPGLQPPAGTPSSVSVGQPALETRQRQLPTKGAVSVLGYRDDIALVRQWQGSPVAPLDSDAIWGEIAKLLRPYRCNVVVSDEWACDEHATIARMHGLYLQPYPTKTIDKAMSCQAIETALSAHERGHLHHRSLELHPCPALLHDLARIERKAQRHGVAIDYPVSTDGRHCDLAAALVKGYTQVLQRPDAEAPPMPANWTQDELDEAERYAASIGLGEGTPEECVYEEMDEDG